MKVASLLNGVDVDHLMEIIEAVRSTPELAKFRFHARNRWIEGTHNRTSIQGFYGVGMEDTSRTKPVQVNNDGPPVLLGENRGADPVEFIFHALAGSMTTTFVANAAAQGVKIDSIETELEGDLDLRAFLGITDGVRPGYREIRVTFRVTSDAPRKKIEELLELARQRSPVYDVISNPTPIRVTLAE
jgi:uncharacterized OsmC-like protein